MSDDGQSGIVERVRSAVAGGVPDGGPSLSHADMNDLRRASEDQLRSLGLRRWSDGSGLWLLPHGWHPHMPDDHPLVSITGRTESLSELSEEPESRGGVLPVGFVPDFERTDKSLLKIYDNE